MVGREGVGKRRETFAFPPEQIFRGRQGSGEGRKGRKGGEGRGKGEGRGREVCLFKRARSLRP